MRTPAIIALVLAACTQLSDDLKYAFSGSGISYPPTKTVRQVDEYHGYTVEDPYRWLEDLDSPETKKWVAAQNAFTFSHLAQIPQRVQIKNRMTQLWDHERRGVPVKKGRRYFYTRNTGLQDQDVLCWSESLRGKPIVLIDPNALAEDGTTSLADYSVSPDGGLVAYGLQEAGSDWTAWRIRNVATGRDLPDVLRWIKFGRVAWTRDSMGFFYSRFPKPRHGATLEQANFSNRLYYHRLGRKQLTDVLVHENRNNRKQRFTPWVTDDGKYLVISVREGTDDRNMVLIRRLDLGEGERVAPLIDELRYEYSLIGNDGPVFYFETTDQAPRGRIIAIDADEPGMENWREVVPQADGVLRKAALFGDRFVVTYMHDVHDEIELFDLEGNRIGVVELLGIGSVEGFLGDRNVSETFYSYTSFTQPTLIYRYDLGSGRSTFFHVPKIDFNPPAFMTTQVFFDSDDGTQIPMFISHKRDRKLDGENPTYLFGYGGFNSTWHTRPRFSVRAAVWMEMGGVYAVAGLRGGGEYGEYWHESGRLKNKQNVFDDFAAAARWLIANEYTSTPRLAIGGRSNGGLLVGASIAQRPELFGAAAVEVGVLDMLRFHQFTIGWAWVDEYGSSGDPELFRTLFAYSPVHQVRRGTRYPPTIITAADHDDRVVPSHSYKFAAALQAAQAAPEPVLLRVETEAGHSSGKPVAKDIEESADVWAFLLHELGVWDPAQAESVADAPAATDEQ